MKFRKKPVIIEAVQWWSNGEYEDVVKQFSGTNIPADKICAHCGRFMEKHGWVDTLEGGHIVCPGDWIIKGVNGEMYPCKPDIFEKTYEPVEEGNNERH